MTRSVLWLLPMLLLAFSIYLYPSHPQQSLRPQMDVLYACNRFPQSKLNLDCVWMFALMVPWYAFGGARGMGKKP